MSAQDLVLWMFPALLVLIFLGIPVAFSLMLVSVAFGLLRFNEIVVHQFVTRVDEIASNYVLGAVPLFIFMGAILQRAGVAERLFDAIQLWTRRLPGGLAVGALIMCTIFAATSGVVGATETMVGMLALPPMLKYGYDKRLVSGTICAGGSLGTVIPPSITVIVLAPMANLPVGDLFAGIMVPGLLMALLFTLYIIVRCTLNPELAPRGEESEYPLGFVDKLRMTALAIIPPIILIFLVLGTILWGLATPTEAAACGALGTLLLAALHRRLTFEMVRSAAIQTMSITSMILLIVLGGSMFSGVFFASGGMLQLQGVLQAADFPVWGVVLLIFLITFVLGFALDLISIVLIVVPITMPLVQALGVDPLWYAVTLLVLMQTSYLTPPMAPSIFYLRAIAPPEIRLTHMYRGVTPFIMCQLATLALLTLCPPLATWLPQLLYGSSF
jgi:tripartite ATP-independent transporter DctM subunit